MRRGTFNLLVFKGHLKLHDTVCVPCYQAFRHQSSCRVKRTIIQPATQQYLWVNLMLYDDFISVSDPQVASQASCLEDFHFSRCQTLSRLPLSVDMISIGLGARGKSRPSDSFAVDCTCDSPLLQQQHRASMHSDHQQITQSKSAT